MKEELLLLGQRHRQVVKSKCQSSGCGRRTKTSTTKEIRKNTVDITMTVQSMHLKRPCNNRIVDHCSLQAASSHPSASVDISFCPVITPSDLRHIRLQFSYTDFKIYCTLGTFWFIYLNMNNMWTLFISNSEFLWHWSFIPWYYSVVLTVIQWAKFLKVWLS